MYTGDDFNYAELIAGDGERHSHALLGIFDPIAPAAAAALAALGAATARRTTPLLAPTVPLSRKVFEAPTQYYKAGVVFLAWLNGHQDHFTMVGGMQSARSASALRRGVPARRPRPAPARPRPRGGTGHDLDGAAWRRLSRPVERWPRAATPSTTCGSATLDHPLQSACRFFSLLGRAACMRWRGAVRCLPLPPCTRPTLSPTPTPCGGR